MGLLKADSALRAWRAAHRVDHDRMVILNQVWEREAGHFSRFWALVGLRRGILYVRVNSPAAAQELQMRGSGLVRSLNKHFKRAWIKGIRPARG